MTGVRDIKYFCFVGRVRAEIATLGYDPFASFTASAHRNDTPPTTVIARSEATWQSISLFVMALPKA
jgi:hypothetical protein